MKGTQSTNSGVLKNKAALAITKRDHDVNFAQQRCTESRLFLIHSYIKKRKIRLRRGVLQVNVRFDGMDEELWTHEPELVYKQWKQATDPEQLSRVRTKPLRFDACRSGQNETSTQKPLEEKLSWTRDQQIARLAMAKDAQTGLRNSTRKPAHSPKSPATIISTQSFLKADQ